MLSPGAARIAADIAAQALEIIMKVQRTGGQAPIDRNPEQIILIGAIIQQAIETTQPRNIFEAMEVAAIRNKSVKQEDSGRETSSD